jgi:hypothetical protein
VELGPSHSSLTVRRTLRSASRPRGPGPDSTRRDPGPAGPGRSLRVKLAWDSGRSGPGSAFRVGSLAAGPGITWTVVLRRARSPRCLPGWSRDVPLGTGGGRRPPLPGILSVVDKVAWGRRGDVVPPSRFLVGALGVSPCQSIRSRMWLNRCCRKISSAGSPVSCASKSSNRLESNKKLNHIH